MWDAGAVEGHHPEAPLDQRLGKLKSNQPAAAGDNCHRLVLNHDDLHWALLAMGGGGENNLPQVLGTASRVPLAAPDIPLVPPGWAARPLTGAKREADL